MEPEEQNQQSQPELQQQPVQPPQEQWQTPIQPEVAAKAAFSMPKWAIITIISVVTVIVVGIGGWFVYKYMARTNATDNTQNSGTTTNNSSSNTDYKNKTIDVKPYLGELLKGKWYVAGPENWVAFEGSESEGKLLVHTQSADPVESAGIYRVTDEGRVLAEGYRFGSKIGYYDGIMMITELTRSDRSIVQCYDRDGSTGFDWLTANMSAFDSASTVNDLYKAGVLDPNKNLLFK